MCLAIPGKIISINEEKTTALCDFVGIKREVNIQMLSGQVSEDDYVLVHVGYAIQKVSTEEALESIKLWKELGDADEDLNLMDFTGTLN